MYSSHGSTQEFQSVLSDQSLLFLSGVKNSNHTVPGAKSDLWKPELEVHVAVTQAALQAYRTQ